MARIAVASAAIVAAAAVIAVVTALRNNSALCFLQDVINNIIVSRISCPCDQDIKQIIFLIEAFIPDSIFAIKLRSVPHGLETKLAEREFSGFGTGIDRINEGAENSKMGQIYGYLKRGNRDEIPEFHPLHQYSPASHCLKRRAFGTTIVLPLGRGRRIFTRLSKTRTSDR